MRRPSRSTCCSASVISSVRMTVIPPLHKLGSVESLDGHDARFSRSTYVLYRAMVSEVSRYPPCSYDTMLIDLRNTIYSRSQTTPRPHNHPFSPGWFRSDKARTQLFASGASQQRLNLAADIGKGAIFQGINIRHEYLTSESRARTFAPANRARLGQVCQSRRHRRP